MVPWSASISRLASRNSVVLPDPEPPTMARNAPPRDLERHIVHGQNTFRARAAVEALDHIDIGDHGRFRHEDVGPPSARAI